MRIRQSLVLGVSAVLILNLEGCGTTGKYDWNEDLHHRLLTDFSKKEPEVKSYIMKYIPDVTENQMREWEASNQLECMTIDGEKRYFKNAAPNLFRINPECKALKDAMSPPSEGSEKIDAVNVPAIMRQVRANDGKSPLAMPVRMKVAYTLSVKADAVPSGQMIRCWLPYPRNDQDRQTGMKFIGASEKKYMFSPKKAEHSTLYMEKRAIKGQPTIFREEFEYVSYGAWHDLDSNKVLPYKPGKKGSGISRKDYVKYTSEREAHIIFSPRLRKIADSLTAGETNPYVQAKKIFRWVNDNFPWASAREYSTIGNIPEYVLENRHGDCGQVSLLFITLCRIKGIPAHFESGFMMHPGYWNLHDWAQIYFEGIGWVPADQSFGIPEYARKGSDEEYFFLGGLDSYRLIVNEDFGKRLYPAKKYPRSETVDFQRGEVEWNGGNLYFPDWDYEMKIEYGNQNE